MALRRPRLLRRLPLLPLRCHSPPALLPSLSSFPRYLTTTSSTSSASTKAQDDSAVHLSDSNTPRDHYSELSSLVRGLLREPRADAVDEALVSFHEMVEADQAFPILIRFLFRRLYTDRRVDDMWEAYQAVLRCAPHRLQTHHHLHALIHLLLIHDRFDDAMSVLRGMLQRRGTSSPETHTFNMLINHLAKRGDADDANDLLQEMLDLGFKPDRFTSSITLRADAQATVAGDAADTHSEGSAARHTAKSRNALEPLLVSMDRLLDMPEELTRDSVSFNQLMNQFFVAGYGVGALATLRLMLQRDVRPDMVTVRTMLQGVIRLSSRRNAGGPPKDFPTLLEYLSSLEEQLDLADPPDELLELEDAAGAGDLSVESLPLLVKLIQVTVPRADDAMFSNVEKTLVWGVQEATGGNAVTRVDGTALGPNRHAYDVMLRALELFMATGVYTNRPGLPALGIQSAASAAFSPAAFFLGLRGVRVPTARLYVDLVFRQLLDTESDVWAGVQRGNRRSPKMKDLHFVVGDPTHVVAGVVPEVLSSGKMVQPPLETHLTDRSVWVKGKDLEEWMRHHGGQALGGGGRTVPL